MKKFFIIILMAALASLQAAPVSAGVPVKEHIHTNLHAGHDMLDMTMNIAINPHTCCDTADQCKATDCVAGTHCPQGADFDGAALVQPTRITTSERPITDPLPRERYIGTVLPPPRTRKQ